MKKVLFISALFISFLGCKKEDNQTASPQTEERKVMLKVEGVGSFRIEYSINGDHRDVTTVSPGWIYEYDGKKGDKITYTPQSKISSNSNLKGTIFVDGKEVSSCTSNKPSGVCNIEYTVN